MNEIELTPHELFSMGIAGAYVDYHRENPSIGVGCYCYSEDKYIWMKNALFANWDLIEQGISEIQSEQELS